MKTTTYICDKCKQSKSESDIVPINVSYSIQKSGNTFKHNQSANKDICKQCLEKLGLLTTVPAEEANEALQKNTKTLESKFIDILEDLGVAFVD